MCKYLDIKNLNVNKGTFCLSINSLNIKSGQVVLLLGPNGGGKTTFLKAVSGIIKSGGYIGFNGTDSASLKRKQRAKIFSYLPQVLTVTDIYVRDFLIMGRFPYTSFFSVYRSSDWHILEAVSEKFNIIKYLNRNLSSLSQGELQRVMLAKVFVQESEVLLLDEPTASLDIGHKRKISEGIYSYLECNPGALIFVATHEPDIFIDKVQNILMLKEGRIFCYGNKENVYKNEKINRLFL